MAQGNAAGHERINDLTIARLINKAHGGPVISAMEVEGLDDNWIDVFIGIMVDLPHKQERQKIIRRKFDEFERNHPTYGKYTH